MIMFKMIGLSPNGIKQELTWDSGRVKGERAAVAEFLMFARNRELVSMGNMVFDANPAKMAPAFALMREYFGCQAQITGEVPVMPKPDVRGIP